MSGEITVILTVYKRPHVLRQQLDAVRNQTHAAKQIIIWKNHADGYDIPEDIRNDKTLQIIDSNHNYGVWARFSVGLLANTEFVCVFDDDTIPGKKWLENCITTMKQVNGLLGTIGVVFDPNVDKYSVIRHPRPGWEAQDDVPIQVDIVGHSWFFKREWLHYLWEITPDYDVFLRSGEDIAFSYVLQKHGIFTYTPPHPKNDLEMFGSIPHFAHLYGNESVAIGYNNPNFDYAFNYFKQKGFQFLEK